MGDETEFEGVPEEKGSFKTKAIFAAIGLAALAAAWLFGAFVAPAWWSRRIGDIADGRLWFSGFLGLAVGFACTLVPLLFLRIAWRLRRGTKRAITVLVAAILIAAPNLVLLGIVTGDSDTAHNAERSLGTDAPWFRSWSLFGAIGGLVAFLGLTWLLFSRNRNKKKAKSLEQAADDSKA